MVKCAAMQYQYVRYLVRAQAIYNFAVHSQALCNSIEFCDTLYCKQASPTN